MKKNLLLLVFILGYVTSIKAQEQSTETIQKFMQITTLESVVSGGFGRSKMVITKADGNQEEKDMNNLFSLTGLNMKNIKENESDILKTLKQYTDDGWKLLQVTPLTLSPSDKASGIFMTRYLLTKTEEKKGF